MNNGHLNQIAALSNFSHTIIQTLGRQLFVIALGLGTVVLLARTLGPEGRGQYAIALLLATSLVQFLNLGIASANVYFLGQNKVSVRTALATSIQLWWKLSIVGIIIAILIISFKANTWFPNTSTSSLLLSLVVFPISLLQAYVISLLQGIQDFKRYNLALLVTPVITFFTAIILVLFAGQGVLGALIASIIGIFMGLITSLLAIKNHWLNSKLNFDENYNSRCLTYGWKAHLSNILAFANYKADIFMVNLFLTSSDVGIYVVAVNLVEQLWVLSSAVSTVTLPRLAELHRDEAKRKILTPIIARLVLFTTLLGSIILAVFAKPLVIILFGPEFIKATNAMMGLIPGIVVLSLARALANDIAARGRPELNTYASIFVVLINITFNIFLIPLMGILGAAIATSISYVANAIFILFIYSRLSKNKWWEPFAIQKKDILYVFNMKAEKD